MDCARADELLQQAAAGTLSAADRAAWLAHAVACPTCGPRRDELRFAELARPASPGLEPLPAAQLARLAALADESQSAVELALGGPLRFAVPTVALAAVVLGLCLMRLGPAFEAQDLRSARTGWFGLAGAQGELLEELTW